SAEPQWVSLTLDDGAERPRVELSTVPYAFKASDADTLGGRNSGEFVTQQQLTSLLAIPKWPTPIPWSPLAGTRVAPTFEATAAVGPSFITNATTGPPLQVNSDALVQKLNADLLHGLSDSAFAKLIGNNSFPGFQT